MNLCWIFALTLCGPVRTVLVFEHGETILISMFMGIFANGQKGNYARARGTLMFFLGVLCLLIFDNDNSKSSVTTHPEGEHVSTISHWMYSLTSFLGMADHKGGIVLLVLTLILKIAVNGYSKRVGSLVGGVKRLNALSTLMSAVFLFPWAVLLSVGGSGFNVFAYLFPLLFVTVSVFVIDYYGQSLLSAKMDPVQISRLGYFFISVTALILGFHWSHPAAVAISKLHGGTTTVRTAEHVISGGVIVGTIFLFLSTDILSWPNPKSQKGSFIGYSSEGMPLYRFADDVLQRASKTSFGALAQGFLSRVLEEKDSRHIFYFLCINLSFAFVELAWGLWSNSLGLVSDSFHMLFDCSALILGLIAAVMAKWKSTRIFPYGYGRIEVLSGFVNGLFLLVVACFLLIEALQRILDPPNINTDKLMAVSVAGLLVNLIGVFVFRHQHHHHGHSHDHSHDHSHHHHENANLKAIYLHVLADLLGSVGVIISSFMIDRWQLLIADPICTILVAMLILSTVWPLLRDSARVLTLCIPPCLENNVRKALAKVSNINGVIGVRTCRVWQHTDEDIVAVITIHVKPHVIEQRVISQVTAIVRDFGITTVTVQVEKEDFYQHMSGLMSGTDDAYQIALQTYQSPSRRASTSESESEYTKLV
uniref:Proton-coupled zinc antiporter SLC30A5 n=1 Tax=Phallusia mammillata TaxID=59560 RepID=A0A6F9DT67_9ASCI|nr:zinc transporter 5-like [Phallusia mammillata]